MLKRTLVPGDPFGPFTLNYKSFGGCAIRNEEHTIIFLINPI